MIVEMPLFQDTFYSSDLHFSEQRLDSSLSRTLSLSFIIIRRGAGHPLISIRGFASRGVYRLKRLGERRGERERRALVARGPIINSRLIGFSVLIPGPIVIIPDGCNYRRGNIRLHVVESLRAAVHVITFPSFAGLN